MIYLFVGDDIKNKLQAYNKFIKLIPPNVEKFFINRNDFDPIQVENFYSNTGLFFTKCAIVFSDILEKEETSKFILSKLNLLNSSENLFIFSEKKLNKSTIDAFKKHDGILNIFELPKQKKEKFNNFLLANAFEQKDKLNLWIYYRQAVGLGVGLEELVGVLFWKAKDMLLKKNFKKLSAQQLQGFITKISYLLPEARSKGQEAEIVFEQFLLQSL